MSLTPQTFFQMEHGDSIQLVVDESDLNEKERGVNVVGIKTAKYGEMLNITHVNECQKKGWARVLWTTLLLALAFLFPVIRKRLQKNDAMTQR